MVEKVCSRCKKNKSNGKVLLMGDKKPFPNDEYCDRCAFEINSCLIYGQWYKPNLQGEINNGKRQLGTTESF